MPLPDLRMRAFVPALLGACLFALSFASAANAKTISGDLRVVDGKGRTLAQQTQYTGAGAKLKSDKRADCFGKGTGGSGKRVDIPAYTAMNQLADAGVSDRSVRPLSITDHFDFGLGLCSIGKAEAPQSGFWYLKVDHVASQIGGDQTAVGPGDDVLWYLIRDYTQPTPDELALIAPATAKPGGDVTVRVVSYDDAGKRTPAAGVTVSGANGPTDAQGRTTVPADQPMLRLTATRSGAIPSNAEFVCTQGPAECPAGYAERIGGSKAKDRIRVGSRATTVIAGGGDDRIVVKRGAYGDRFRCGGGKDLVEVPKQVKKRSGFSGCERVRIAR